MHLTTKWWKWLIGFFPSILLIISILLSLFGIPLTEDGDPLGLVQEEGNYIGFYIFLAVAQLIWLAWGVENLFEKDKRRNP